GSRQRSAHASAHAEKGARVAAALYRSDCQTRRGTGAGRVDRAWMEQRLLAVTGGSRPTGKGRKSRVGWEPFRTVLLIMLDSGLRPGEIFRMRWENIHWDK